MGIEDGTRQFSEELLERAGELARISQLLAAVEAGGDGAVLVVAGPAGIGKTSLLDACVQEADERGMTVLRVRGDDLAMESSFSAVRELLEREVQAAGAGAFEGAARLAAPVFVPDSPSVWDRERMTAVLHGLYWLIADLAERKRLALIVDDAHWLDAASSRFLVYLARRADALPVLLAVAARPGEAVNETSLLALLSEVAAARLEPAAFSLDAAEVLIRRELGARADPELCRSCHEATGGNPFYLRELVVALRAEGERPTLDSAHRARTIGAGAVGKSVLVRLGRMDADCQRLAEVLAVLAPGSPLRRAAALAGLPRERAERAADALRAADLVAAHRTLSFGHPIVREVIAAEMAPSRRAGLHSAAAELLRNEDAPPEDVAAHLLSSEPYGASGVVEVLRVAARSALARGAPEAAVSYLRRALAEPPQPELRLELLLELGRAEVLLPSAHDFVSLREALELAPDPQRRAEIALELALGLFGVLRNRDARAVLASALEREDELDDETASELEQALIGAGGDDLAALPEVLTRAARHWPRALRGDLTDPRMLASLAAAGAMASRHSADVASLATRALADERLLTAWLHDGFVTASLALCWAEEHGEARAALERGLREAERRAFAPMIFQLATVLCETHWRSGDLDGAEDYSERSMTLGRELGAEEISMMWQPLIWLERGRTQEAAAMVASWGEPDSTWFGASLRVHRGRVRIAVGDHKAGLADLLDADAQVASAGGDLSVTNDWAAAAAAALAALGCAERAREIAQRELERAVAFGAPRRQGIALSTCGALDDGDQGLTWLTEGAQMLERAGDGLERARALLHLGMGQRARGKRVEARGPLSQGLDIASRCGASALAESLRAALVSCGARPRRAMLTGAAALTPAELRTARMAAEGLTNREIAQALFVSTKAIEGQLSQAYTKLGIHGRAELAETLRREAAQG